MPGMGKSVIHIFGASGSGTTTLGKYISEKLGYFFMDSDDYFWLPTDPKYTAKRDREQRIQLMKKDMETRDKVVISGSLTDWGDCLIPCFTLCLRLVIEPEARLARLKEREKRHFGSRIAPGGDMYENHLKFMEWAAQYDEGGVEVRSKAKHDEWQKLLTCRVLVLNGADTLEHNLEAVRKALEVSSLYK